MKMALGQFGPELGNKEKNLDTMNRLMHKAAYQQADIILFPEFSICGYDPNNPLPEPIPGESVRQMQAWCDECSIYSVFSMAERHQDGKIYNAAVLISNQGEIEGIYRKVHPYDDEKEVFTPGESFKVFETALGRIGIMICFDIDFPEAMRTLMLNHADIVLCPTNHMAPYQDYMATYLKSRSMENELPLAICNRTGAARGLTFFGESAIYDAFGRKVMIFDGDPDLQTAEVLTGQKTDPNLQYIDNRRPSCYQDIAKPSATVSH